MSDPMSDDVDVPQELVLALLDWRSGIEGEVILPDEARYHDTRKLFNPVFDPYPCVVVFCQSEHDVRACLAFCTRHALKFTLRSGGHSTAGYSAAHGKMLIDLSRLDDLVVDVDSMSAMVGAGVNFGKLNAALDSHGVHIPGGECDGVCVAGFMQGGGYGFTSRSFGMTCDNVISIRVMLANGTVVTASAAEHADLWWAMRGGTGGNFGIILSIQFRMWPLEYVWGWAIAWPLDTPESRAEAAQALYVLQRGYMKRGAPREFNSQVMICYQSDVSDYVDMQPRLLVRGMYLGDPDTGRSLLEPLLACKGAVFQYGTLDRYIAMNFALLKLPLRVPQFSPSIGMPYQRKQSRCVSRDLSLAEWRGILDHYVTSPNLLSYMCFEVYGGAINELPEDHNAFIHRDIAFNASLGVFGTTPEEMPVAERFLEDWCAMMEQLWNGHIYQNYPHAKVPDYRWNYFGHSFERLIAIKEKYDRTQMFDFQQAIKRRALNAPDPRAT